MQALCTIVLLLQLLFDRTARPCCCSELSQRAVRLAVTRDELAAQSAAAARAQGEADRLGHVLGRTAEELAAARAESAVLGRQLAAEEDRRAAAQDDLQVWTP